MRNSLPRITIGMARCPNCRELEHSVMKTRRVCAGWTDRRVECKTCGQRFIIESIDDSELCITNKTSVQIYD